jgi:glyoxylase-like metal-dependent hydrolase (beta-lactamase superfamily II)
MTVRRVPVAAPTRAPDGETCAYVVGGTEPLLVDPPDRSADLDSVLEDRKPAHLAVTHHHPDHVGAVAAYAREFDLTVWARRGRADEFADATGVRPDRTFSPGDILPTTPPVTVLDTPGHAPEHVAFAVGDDLVTGDLAVASGSVVVGAPGGDMRAYLSSLRRVHARDPARLLPAHGPIIDDPRATCRRLIEHRLDREARVLAAVESGARTPDEVVERAYDKDVSHVYDLARATVVAHLEKLAVEDAVRWDGSRARPDGCRYEMGS